MENRGVARGDSFNPPPCVHLILMQAAIKEVDQIDESARGFVTPEVRDILSANGKLPWNSNTNFHVAFLAILKNVF